MRRATIILGALLAQRAEAYESFLAVNSNRSVCVVNDSQIIPEPEEYAFVFRLFALSLVVVRQRFHKKCQQAITASWLGVCGRWSLCRKDQAADAY